MMIKQPALAPSPQPRQAPTVRALPAELAAQRGPFWMPIRGPNPTPIDTLVSPRAHSIRQTYFPIGPMPDEMRYYGAAFSHQQLTGASDFIIVRPRNILLRNGSTASSSTTVLAPKYSKSSLQSAMASKPSYRH